MFATSISSPSRSDARLLLLAAIAGVACALAVARALPVAFDAISNVIEPLCASADPTGSALDKVEPIASYSLPNVPGKRVTIVRVFYGPGGFTRPHRHARVTHKFLFHRDAKWRLKVCVEYSVVSSPENSGGAR